MTGGATGPAGIITSSQVYHNLLLELADLNTWWPFLLDIFKTNSLAAVVLQNSRALDTLIAKGGVCTMLNEQCCFEVKQARYKKTFRGSYLRHPNLSSRLPRVSSHGKLPGLGFPGSFPLLALSSQYFSSLDHAYLI